VAAGNCVVIAQQAGNSTYAAATNVVRTISLSKASQSITFAPATTLALNQSPYTLSATASSNLPVSFTSSPASICTVSGTALTLVAAGNCVVIAQQARQLDLCCGY
jgi:uncharacterized protein (DUF2345 family)